MAHDQMGIAQASWMVGMKHGRRAHRSGSPEDRRAQTPDLRARPCNPNQMKRCGPSSCTAQCAGGTGGAGGRRQEVMGEVGVGQATAKPGPRHLSSQMGRRSEKNKSAWLAIAQRRCNSCVIANLLEGGRELAGGGTELAGGGTAGGQSRCSGLSVSRLEVRRPAIAARDAKLAGEGLAVLRGQNCTRTVLPCGVYFRNGSSRKFRGSI